MAQQSAGSGFRVGRVFGIPIYLHTSWFVIFALITLTVTTQFSSLHPMWSTAQHWTVGLVTSFLFFFSVIFHELSHSVVARYYKIRVESITLFVFGGVSKIAGDPDSAGKEFNVAIAGPLSSFFLAVCFWLIFKYVHGSDMVTAAALWLAEINLILAVFNLVPGFPLDGGRILRGIAWAITKDFARATRIATACGKFFAYLMIFYGIWQALHGNWIGGIWMSFIGWFLLNAAQDTFVQSTLRNALAGRSAKDIMVRDVPTVPRDMSLAEYAQEVLKTGRRFHIVTGLDKPVGLVTLHTVQRVPRDEWENTSIQAVMHPIDEMHYASPNEPALGVFERLLKENVSQMPVLDDGRIVGIIGRESLMRLMQSSGHGPAGNPKESTT